MLWKSHQLSHILISFLEDETIAKVTIGIKDLKEYLDNPIFEIEPADKVDVVGVSNGLALDYCVKFTCMDALKLDFITCLHFNGTRAVNVNPDSARNTIYQLAESGVSILA